MNASKLSRSIPQILIIALTLMVLVCGQVSPAAAQSGVVYITSNSQLPVQGQLVIPANVGYSAPAELHGLVVTVWYGGKDDNVASMLHLSDGLAADRSLKYGDSKESYKTVVWDGEKAPISGGQNCRDGFYSDSVVLTEGVVYGDKCPIVIEYHIDHFVSVAPATEVPANPEPYNSPAGGTFSLPNWVVWIFTGNFLAVGFGVLLSLFFAFAGLILWIWSVVVMWKIHWLWGVAALVTGFFFPLIGPIAWILLYWGVAHWPVPQPQ